MNTNDFHTEVHAKCILAGEHAVLKDYPALVFPVKSKFLKLDYRNNDSKLKADFDAPYGETLLTLLWSVLNSSLELVHQPFNKLHGEFFLKNNIPMASGLGFSSAICAAITQWLIWEGWLNAKQLFKFSRKMEDHFHGKSSGVDIAGALANDGVLYSIKDGIKNIPINWLPQLYLSSSEHHCATSSCIEKVNALRTRHKLLGKQLDQQMGDSVLLAEKALAMDAATGFEHLVEAINQAHNCFEQWGLIDDSLRQHRQALFALGAVAAKPTGSGGGGFVLSLWKEPPPKNTTYEFIPLFVS